MTTSNELLDSGLDLPSEFDTLKARANDLGITFHTNIGVDKLREKVKAVLSPVPVDDFAVVAAVEDGVETMPMLRKRLNAEARILIRVNILNNNPNKKDWQGEIFSVSNSAIGTVKRFIPVGLDTHVESILIDQMRERECIQYYSKVNDKGMKVRTHRMIKEFNITVLDSLTAAQLAELALEQASRGTIGTD